MSGDEGFLVRWSRRKRGAVEKARAVSPSQGVAADTASQTSEAAAASAEAASTVDLAQLPPVESIGAETDIRAFLAAGVPPDLTRAALRRAWSADSAIRNFIGLSENSWDFNAPGGVPGFGSLTADEVRKLLAQAIGAPASTDTGQPQPESPSAERSPVSASESDVPLPVTTQDPPEPHLSTPIEPASSQPSNTAMQHEIKGHEYCPDLPRRRHGGALPE